MRHRPASSRWLSLRSLSSPARRTSSILRLALALSIATKALAGEDVAALLDDAQTRLLQSRTAEVAALLQRVPEVEALPAPVAQRLASLSLWCAAESLDDATAQRLAPRVSSVLDDSAGATFESAFALAAWTRRQNKNGYDRDRDRLLEEERLFELAASLASGDAQLAVAHEGIGHAGTRLGHFDVARDQLAAAATLFGASGDAEGVERTARRIVFNEYEAGEYATCMEQLDRHRGLLKDVFGDAWQRRGELRSNCYMRALCAAQLDRLDEAADALQDEFALHDATISSMPRDSVLAAYGMSSDRAGLLIELLAERYRTRPHLRRKIFNLASATIDNARAKVLRRYLSRHRPVDYRLRRDDPWPLPEGMAEFRWYEVGTPQGGVRRYLLLARFGDEEVMTLLDEVERVDALVERFLDTWMTPVGLGGAVADYERDAGQVLEAICGETAAWFRSPTPPRRALVLGDGVIEKLPFEALVRRPSGATSFSAPDYLLRTTTFLTGPSLIVLNLLPAPNEHDTVLAVLDPLLRDASGRALPSLRFANSEGAAIRAAHEDAVLLMREQATRASVEREMVRGQPIGWLHIGCHAVPDPIADGGAALLCATTPTGADRLGVGEVFNMPFTSGCRVVLSACGTSTANRVRGEGVLALWRAFFGVGASCVVSTLRSVDDRSAAAWMAAFHEEGARGVPIAEAAQRASLRWLDGDHPRYPRGSVVADPCHPYLWAAYTCHGNDGGPLPR